MVASMPSHYWLLNLKMFCLCRMVDMIAKRLVKEPRRSMDSRAPMDKKRRMEVGAFHPTKYSSGRIDKDGVYRNNYLSPNPPDMGGLRH